MNSPKGRKARMLHEGPEHKNCHKFQHSKTTFFRSSQASKGVAEFGELGELEGIEFWILYASSGSSTKVRGWDLQSGMMSIPGILERNSGKLERMAWTPFVTLWTAAHDSN